jgi:hypothetical protein
MRALKICWLLFYELDLQTYDRSYIKVKQAKFWLSFTSFCHDLSS